MAGGPSTPGLAAAVSNAGGLGSLGGGYLAPDELRTAIRAVKAATDRPFMVNLFAPEAVDTSDPRIAVALDELAPYAAELGLPRPVAPEHFAPDFDEQVDVVVAEGVPVFSVTFGVPPAPATERLRAAGTVVGATATTVDEARARDDAGVDFVCAQGTEAGGHRGSFAAGASDDLIGLVALVPQVCDAVRVPVVAAGGIADGRGVAAALVLGACAAQLGTAFLLAPEAGTSAPYRDAVRAGRPEATTVTRAFSGRRARGLSNRFARELAGRDDLPPYPVLHALTVPLRRAAAEQGQAELLSLWAGQAVGLVREMPAAELVACLAQEARDALDGAAPEAG
jgi:nitronate monooxygenase